MKGQYFSFDAVVATLIMVVAITSLVAYWFGVQSVVESRNNPMYADSLRIAESLLSPGSPSNWTAYVTGNTADLENIRQIGLAKNFSNELDRNKIEKLQYLVQNQLKYNETGRIMRATGDYFIKIEQTDKPDGEYFEIGSDPAQYGKNATEVSIANRGAVLDDGSGKLVPMRLRLYLWRQ